MKGEGKREAYPTVNPGTRRCPRLTVLVLVVLALPGSLWAQREADHWAFGKHAGLSFGSCRPTVFRSSIEVEWTSVTQSHPRSGRLLFYSDGNTVWDAGHEIMENGENLKGPRAPYFFQQHCLSAPDPADTARFHLFTMAEEAVRGDTLSMRLYRSVIDMSRNGGKGAVVAKNMDTGLYGLSANLTAVPHSQRKGFWIITHGLDNDAFYLSLLTERGMAPPDTVRIGSTYKVTRPDSPIRGIFKPSPDGEKLAVSYRFSKVPYPGDDIEKNGWPFELFDFDAGRGRISNPVSLGPFIFQHGVSFSPDNSKLYLVAVNDRDGLHQFDLRAKDIRASRIGLYLQNPSLEDEYKWGVIGESLELAPDGRLYLGGGRAPYQKNNGLLVINEPNALGTDCRLTGELFPLGDDQEFSFGLPNFIQSTFNGLSTDDNPTEPCTRAEAYGMYPQPAEGHLLIKVPERCFTPYLLRVYSSIGQAVLARRIDSQVSGRIPLAGAAPGVYLAVMEFEDRHIVKKFVKQ